MATRWARKDTWDGDRASAPVEAEGGGSELVDDPGEAFASVQEFGLDAAPEKTGGQLAEPGFGG